MSDQAKKLQAKGFALDQPMTIRVNATGPDGNPWVTSGTSEWGEWWLWDVTANGEKRSFFPSPQLQASLVAAGPYVPGTVVSVTKRDNPQGEGVAWEVTRADNAGPVQPSTAPASSPAYNGADRAAAVDRMAFAALLTARKQLKGVVDAGGDPFDYTTEDTRAWAATILIAYQKAGLGPDDFPDIEI